MFTLTWVHTCLIDFLQEDTAGMKCLAEVIPCSDSTSLWLMIPNMYKTKTKKKQTMALFGLLVHAFAPSSMRENNPHTCRQRVQKNVPRAVVGVDMFVW